MTGQQGQGRQKVGAAAMAVVAALCVAPAYAQTNPTSPGPTASGSRISNTANASFTTDAGETRIASNTVTLTVDQVIEAAITANAPAVPAAPTLTAVGFVVSNPGNATERYSLSATVDVAGVEIAGFAVDSDGNGSYDAAVDAALTDATLNLDSGARRRIFVLVRNAASAPKDVTVTATVAANRGHGAPGTVIAGAGDNGVDVVVGGTGGQASASARITGDAATPSLLKSQTVLAPNGTARVMPGSIITYQIEARFPLPVRAPEITDVIPDGVDFVPGSMTLDGQPLTDAAGDDAGTFDGTQVRVALGDQAGTSTRIVRFQTKIR